jgi:predicted dehydrogenase
MTRKSGFNRRQFLAGTATAASFTIIPRHVLGTADMPSANNKLNVASVGVGGMGFNDIRSVPTENVVALCDVDAQRVAHAMQQFPGAKPYRDYRRLLDEEKSLDAVMIATPDHNHAIVTMAALKRGKHVFCQKPLTRTVHEALEIGKAAQAAGVATQMGNQGQASEEARLVSEFIWCGAIGNVREIHGWSNRRPDISPRGIPGHAARPGEPGLGSVAGPGAGAALSSVLLAVPLARLVGFRHRCAGRYRLS